jgi:hypothetical protein
MSLGVALLLATALGHASGAPIEFFNETDNAPNFLPFQFQITFAGIVNIPPQPFPDSAINPFLAPVPTSVTNSGGNTIVTYAGNTWPYAPGTLVHFGLVEVNGAPPPILHILDKQFDSSLGFVAHVTAPAIAPAMVQPGMAADNFAVLLLQAQDPSNPSSRTQTWQEISFPSSQPIDLTIGNFTTTPFVISDARFFISPTEIPLDDLNLTNLPPTDPRFAPLSVLDGVQLNPGQSLLVSLSPEPSSFVLLTAGMVGLLGFLVPIRRTSCRNHLRMS